MSAKTEITRSPFTRNLFYAAWNGIVFIVTLFASFLIPLEMISSSRVFDFDLRLNWILTFVYTLDIFIFLMDIKSNDRHVFVSYDIVKGYFRGWIYLDILAAIPFFLFPLPGWFILFRLFKLAKLEYLFSLMRSELVTYTNTLVLLSILYWLSIIAHGLSCGWLFVRGLDNDIDLMSNYIGALYWSLATITTVGYGDVTPVTDTERLYAVFTMLTGYTLFAYMIGSIASLLSKSSPAKERFRTNLEKLSNAIKYADLPVVLQRKIIAYYTYIYSHNLGYDEASFIDDLPRSLKREVSFHFRKEVMEQVSLFEGADEEFFREIAPSIKLQIMLPGEYVFRQGDTSDDMYLVSRGKVEIYVDDNPLPVRTLNEGDFFGEIALFKDIPRTATVKAASYCDLYVLNKRTFRQAIARFPEVGEKLLELANERVSKNNNY